jgi:hypothetical protein
VGHNESDPYSAPRNLSESHPDAVGTLADSWLPWLDREFGFVPRPWQRVVFERALEVDAEGRLCWRNVVVSCSRQNGKSLMIRALAVARASHAAEIGEPQEVLHVANNLMAGRRILLGAARWATDRGLVIRKAQGQEQITWDDDSCWVLSSASAIYGHSASLGLLDECWDLAQDVLESALLPTLLERMQPQCWLVSTAHAECTPLMPAYRRLALEGDARTMIADWGADPGADPMDPATHRAASPHWSAQRGELMMAARHQKSFKQQFLNVWPGEAPGAVAGWIPGWDGCPSPSGDPPTGGIASVEVSLDRSRYGVATARVRDDSAVEVWSRTARSLPEALEVLNGWGPSVVLAGVSIKDEVAVGSWEVRPAGLRETRVAGPWLQDAVVRGRLAHDHDPATDAQFAVARSTPTEHGEMLSAKRSAGAIPTVKAVVWSSYGAATGIVEEPQIW